MIGFQGLQLANASLPKDEALSRNGSAGAANVKTEAANVLTEANVKTEAAGEELRGNYVKQVF